MKLMPNVNFIDNNNNNNKIFKKLEKWKKKISCSILGGINVSDKIFMYNHDK